jgi:imidazolonepropionase-like amidohydrolase
LRFASLAAAVLLAGSLSGCAEFATKPKPAPPVFVNEDPYPSTYVRYRGVVTVVRHATVFDGDGRRYEDGTVVLADGVIQAVGGAELASPAGALEIDGTDKWVTPGIIDIHSHLGDYPSPSVDALSDGNEATSPVRPEVWAEHSVWPQDPGFSRALINGGVTTLQILPGSANLFGGRSVVVKNVPARTTQGMKFPGAPYGLKMACGENPKRVYGSKGNMPQTRMGNIALARATWIKAQAYKRKWDKYYRNGGDMPERDLAMDTLKGVLEGKILVQNHCYRADEMAQMIDMSKEFGYHIAAFHHAVEAYKIADLLRENDICAVMWADW